MLLNRIQSKIHIIYQYSFGLYLSTIVEDVFELCKKEYLRQGEVRSGSLRQKSPLKATEDMINIENVHKKRIERVHDVCEKYQNVYSMRPKIGDSFVFDVNNGFAWCYVPKVVTK